MKSKSTIPSKYRGPAAGLVPGGALDHVRDHFGIIGHHEVTCIRNDRAVYASHARGLIALHKGSQVSREGRFLAHSNKQGHGIGRGLGGIDLPVLGNAR